ncbi:hypothetical protein BCR32DRAFT_327324 [Anaeromyces robustus]|uniref:Uncharacterized protein n=1 Tax=Anaeromyces robustus TaxID=1754192 RepID=A0A1Y1X7Q3_9FUNG|nr:hypothetical protein BCR32DRAFT_327324 [Anaeromyces robustus]|eukprot:ORX81364.1 hypothetical protein BCR32DRAFT_327324 [Anaeromyces robustus]
MKFFNSLFYFLAVSCFNALVAGYPSYKPSEGSSYLDFPPFENDFTGKNGFYILYYENKNRFPTLVPALGCRLNMRDTTIFCRVEDSVDTEVIKKDFGGVAQLIIDDLKIYNPNNCKTFEKYLTEVTLYNEENIEDQIIGTTLGDLYSKKFSFKLNDECEFSAEFKKFHLEKS